MKNKELLREDVETIVDEFKIDIGAKVSIEWGIYFSLCVVSGKARWSKCRVKAKLLFGRLKKG